MAIRKSIIDEFNLDEVAKVQRTVWLDARDIAMVEEIADSINVTVGEVLRVAVSHGTSAIADELKLKAEDLI